MSTLRLQDTQALLGALDHLYEPVTAADFPTHAIGVVDRMIPQMLTTFDIVHQEPAKGFSVASRPVDPAWHRHVVELMPEHPSVIYLREGGQAPVIMITDVMTQRQFRQTRIYDECFRPAGGEYQIAGILPVKGGVAGIALNRERPFTERERALLLRLHSHLLRAWTLAQARSALAVPASAARALTARELEVFHWLGEGKRDKEIAVILGIGWRTVQSHVTHILEKLGVETRTAALATQRPARACPR